MKQLVQDWKQGQVRVREVPSPGVTPGQVLVRTRASLISAGTERAVVEFAEKSLLAKARARPELVRQVIDKVRRDGILSAWETVSSRLEQPLALGYSSAGEVLDVPADVAGFRTGDRVACAGGDYASHAEIVSVPRNLVVPLPENVPFEWACFSTLGSIALHGIRLAEVKLGETVAVIGLGLVGQLTVQLLKAAGCIVVGTDPDTRRAELALDCGADAAATSAEEFEALVRQHSQGAGADAVLITASTSSSQPLEAAGNVARDKAIVVAVGAVGMTLPRKTYYMKELDFRISRSYGPGRYDPSYEEQGHDYPIGFVRWTEHRNLRAFVLLLGEGKLNLEPLITHRFPLSEAPRAYELITGKSDEPVLAVVLNYPGEPATTRRIELLPASPAKAPTVAGAKATVRLGVLGAGSFARAMLLPALKQLPGVEFAGVVCARGATARSAADKFGFRFCSTDENELLATPEVDAVVIATRHHLHGRQTLAALRAGKHVFVEKPLTIFEEELQAIAEEAAARPSQVLFVGFNRRFAPLAQELKRFFTPREEALFLHYRVNAGFIPPEHWAHDPAQGGGRILGEVCHFVDFAGWLAGAAPRSVDVAALPDQQRYHRDNVSLTLAYPDGSLALITYLANGSRKLGKERIEVHGSGRSAVLDDFRRLELWSGHAARIKRTWLRQDKGHRQEMASFLRAVRGEASPAMTLPEILAATQSTFAAARSLRKSADASEPPAGTPV